MTIHPAIDLIDGRCVRLWKGRFDRRTDFDESPAEIAARYAATGAKLLHVVDLDAARTGTPSNLATLQAIRESVPTLDVQWGGGLRTRDAVDEVLSLGATRVLVGSVAATEPQRVGAWIHEFGADRIVAAVDVRNEAPHGYTYIPAVSGWIDQSDRDLWDVLDELVGFGLRHLLSTDIDRDGTGAGSNVELYRELVSRYPQLQVQASGGVGSVEDLARVEETGVVAVVVGRALLDGTLNPEEVLC